MNNSKVFLTESGRSVGEKQKSEPIKTAILTYLKRQNEENQRDISHLL